MSITNEKLKRERIWEFQSDIAHELFLEMYGNYENFINIPDGVHPLEDYINSYDDNIDNFGIIISIGERIGFGIDYDESGAYPPSIQFYDRCSFTIRNNTVARISKIMKMDQVEYASYMKAKGIQSNLDMYYDRLNIDSHNYDKKLIKQFLNLLPRKQSPKERLSLDDEGIIDETLVVDTPDDEVFDVLDNRPAPDVPNDNGELSVNEIDHIIDDRFEDEYISDKEEELTESEESNESEESDNED